MAKIKKIIAREILDSRGVPTIEAIVELADSSVGVFSTPSGISVGKSEAVELRDSDPKRYGGLGVLTCLEKIVQVLAPIIIGQDAKDQAKLDGMMIEADGTENKQNLGANTLLALSGAIVKAQATSYRIPLYQYISRLLGRGATEFVIPTPMFNLINGGKHANRNLDFQEFMIVPTKANSYTRNLKIGVECYYSLKETLKSHSASTLIGDEGGFAPMLYSNMDAFKMLEEAAVKAGYKLGLDLFFALDAAATNIKQGESYRLKDKPVPLLANELIDFYLALNEQYHLLSIEDPIQEDDWDGWKAINQKLGTETLIVGDDLVTTNLQRVQRAVEEKACGAIIVKPNQIGTITETLEVVRAAQKANLKVMASHRSGETNDDFIADFAVGVGAEYAKFGAPARGERVAKYNRLLEIEHELS
ncbi:phosphopyruvate hydratase [Candidatus Curtissbacteria bacterium]|nr:phosphopyruvate hydratase [Candidatus Curtissbacteria bacterium]